MNQGLVVIGICLAVQGQLLQMGDRQIELHVVTAIGIGTEIKSDADLFTLASDFAKPIAGKV
ncbi:hypothetical protein D9M72_639340 [compost metagenome]